MLQWLTIGTRIQLGSTYNCSIHIAGFTKVLNGFHRQWFPSSKMPSKQTNNLKIINS